MRGLFITVLIVVAGTVFGDVTRGIHVAGTGEVVTVPDMARITLTITQRNRDANVATEAVDQVTRKVLKLTQRLKIADRDVTAARIHLSAIHNRRPNNQTIESIEAKRTITILVKNINRISNLINGSIKVGINGIQGIQLDTSARVKLQREALDIAIADAKREANHVAQQFGVDLGSLIDVHVQPQTTRQMTGMFRAATEMSGSPSPFKPGEIVVRRQVNATFQITTE